MAKVLPFRSVAPSTLKSDQVEALLGQVFLWTDHDASGNRVQHAPSHARHVQVIGWDRNRGLRLVCRGFEACWCSVAKFQELQEEGVLIPS